MVNMKMEVPELGEHVAADESQAAKDEYSRLEAKRDQEAEKTVGEEETPKREDAARFTRKLASLLESPWSLVLEV